MPSCLAFAWIINFTYLITQTIHAQFFCFWVPENAKKNISLPDGIFLWLIFIKISYQEWLHPKPHKMNLRGRKTNDKLMEFLILVAVASKNHGIRSFLGCKISFKSQKYPDYKSGANFIRKHLQTQVWLIDRCFREQFLDEVEKNGFVCDHTFAYASGINMLCYHSSSTFLLLVKLWQWLIHRVKFSE